MFNAQHALNLFLNARDIVLRFGLNALLFLAQNINLGLRVIEVVRQIVINGHFNFANKYVSILAHIAGQQTQLEFIFAEIWFLRMNKHR